MNICTAALGRKRHRAATEAVQRNVRNLLKKRKLLKNEVYNVATTVPASEFTRNFGRYRMRAQREAIAVSSHGEITGYFVGPEEYEELQRYGESRRSFATAELPEEKAAAIATSRMDARHANLDALLDE